MVKITYAEYVCVADADLLLGEATYTVDRISL